MSAHLRQAWGEVVEAKTAGPERPRKGLHHGEMVEVDARTLLMALRLMKRGIPAMSQHDQIFARGVYTELMEALGRDPNS